MARAVSGDALKSVVELVETVARSGVEGEDLLLVGREVEVALGASKAGNETDQLQYEWISAKKTRDGARSGGGEGEKRTARTDVKSSLPSSDN